jgi:rod shape-determining protein MreC
MGSSLTTRFIICTILSLTFIVVDQQLHHLASLRSVLSVIVYPVQVVADAPISIGNWLSKAFSSRSELQEENEALRSHNLLLEARLQKMEALERENRQLRELLDASFRLPDQVLAAEVLAVDLKALSHRVVLNKGSLQGVFEGQPLLDAKGIMGQIIQVGPLSSIALLLTDPNHALPVEVNRNGLRAIAVGEGAADRLQLLYIAHNADIREGDLLVSSGLGGRFPPGYPVGTVTQVAHDTSMGFAQVFATPAAELDKSREVLLVLSTAPSDDEMVDEIAKNPTWMKKAIEAVDITRLPHTLTAQASDAAQ